MRRPAATRKPAYATVADVQTSAHYASHVDQPIRRMPMERVDAATMDANQHACDPDTARGVPSTFNYTDGVIRVWPWPAEGWQVWSEVSGKDVTPL